MAAQVEGTTTAAASGAFRKRLRAYAAGPLIVIWDNGPAHRGAALRSYLQTPDLHLPLVALPTSSPDYNPAELVWQWRRDAGTAKTCFGTAANVAAAVERFFDDSDDRADEVQQRCRSALQTAAFPETSRHSERRLRRREQRRERVLQPALAM